MSLNGLVLASCYITEAQSALLTSLLKAELDALPAPGDGGKGRSKILRYGHDYDQSHRWLRDIPAELQSIWPKSNAVTVNVYLSGTGILPHYDSRDFGDEIRILSLGEPATMEFTRQGYPSVQVLLSHRSMLFMQGEARQLWRHGVLNEKRSGDRMSVVFRTFHVG